MFRPDQLKHGFKFLLMWQGCNSNRDILEITAIETIMRTQNTEYVKKE